MDEEVIDGPLVKRDLKVIMFYQCWSYPKLFSTIWSGLSNLWSFLVLLSLQSTYMCFVWDELSFFLLDCQMPWINLRLAVVKRGYCFIFMFFLETAMTMSWSGTKDLYGFVLWGNQVSKHVGHLRFLESVGHFIGGLIRAGFMNHDVWQMYRHWWLKCSTEHSKRPHKLTCMHAYIYIDADIDTHIHQQRQISCMLVICMHVCLDVCMLYHEISQI